MACFVSNEYSGTLSLAHSRFHIDPGAENPLGQHVRLLVDLLVEDHDSQVGHAQIVNIREGQRDLDVGGGPVFHDAVVLTADVAARFFNVQQFAVEKSLDLFRLHDVLPDD